ncbi:hypothetical protein Ndes2437B_g00535 [Nannochloris sp. 'desiccata']|nr:hypothetical protein KSW81_006158 [Chlorella desiccata (nom. nud.)]
MGDFPTIVLAAPQAPETSHRMDIATTILEVINMGMLLGDPNLDLPEAASQTPPFMPPPTAPVAEFVPAAAPVPAAVLATAVPATAVAAAPLPATAATHVPAAATAAALVLAAAAAPVLTPSAPTPQTHLIDPLHAARILMKIEIPPAAFQPGIPLLTKRVTIKSEKFVVVPPVLGGSLLPSLSLPRFSGIWMFRARFHGMSPP